MIGLDTNVLVRYIAQDDAAQSLKATRLIEGLTQDSPGYVSLVSVIELVWVMAGCYASTKKEICDVLTSLLQTKEIVVAEAETVWKAVRAYQEGNGDFADCLVVQTAKEAGCVQTMTFDRNAAKHSGMKLIT